MKSFFKSKKDKSKVNNDVLSGENSEVKGKKKSADKEKRLKEKIPKEKKPKEKKVKADGKERKQSKILSLRNKIFVAFLVPIIFMIIVGYTAYFNAAEGMSEKFEESTQQTINMAVNYLDMSCTYVQSEGFRYAVDSSLEEYFIGMMKKDKITQSKYISDTRLTLMAAQQANPFIENIHFVTKAGIPIISTATTSLDYDGIYNEYYDDMVAISEDGRTPPKWVDDHARLTEHMGLKMDDYFISYQMPTTSKFAYIVIDIRESAVRDILLDMDL